MESDFLNEIYSDINKLNKVIQNEIDKERIADIVDISLSSSDNVSDFLKDLSHNDSNNKIIQLDKRKTLKRQLECTKIQKKIVQKILK